MGLVIRSAAVSIVPVFAGSGQQNKILDSIVNLTPIVSTSYAAGPLGLVSNVHLLTANEPVSFFEAIFPCARTRL